MKKLVMRKNKRGRRNGNKERVQMRSLIGDEEITTEIEIAIEKGINVVDVRMTKGIAVTQAVIGNANIKFSKLN